MKAYKIEILIVDFDKRGGDAISDVIENTSYPNHFIRPEVMKVTEADIGEWYDGHPLNLRDQTKSEYERLFSRERKGETDNNRDYKTINITEL